MVNASTGVNFGVYAKTFLKYGDTVTHTPVTKTLSNVTGDETLTDGTGVNINAYIVRKNAPWFLDKAGLIQGGDALMLVSSAITITKDDKITWNSNTYRVQDVLLRNQIGGNCAYTLCNLFLI
jgi:hypothetical protein